MDFKKYYCCNDDIISVLCKLVMLRFETTSGSENGCGKWHLCSEIGSEFGEPCGASPSPQQQFPGVPTCGNKEVDKSNSPLSLSNPLCVAVHFWMFGTDCSNPLSLMVQVLKPYSQQTRVKFSGVFFQLFTDDSLRLAPSRFPSVQCNSILFTLL